jgi:type I restriction enzyme M protein
MAIPEYSVFMAVVDRTGINARGNLLFQRAPDGEELFFDEVVIELICEGGEVKIRQTTRRNRRIHDELPLVAEKYKEFRATGEVMF